MIAKILKASRSMSGVLYNEDKVLKGKAEMIDASNFPPHCMNAPSVVKACADYLDFLCKLRPDISSRQFHATISVAGDELTKEQLLEVAKEYMKAMGFGDQPYLVFFHKDTDNNHVHIVSTRVRLDRTLIPDGNERRRSLATIKRICREKGYTPLVTKKEEAAKAIEEALNWKFKHAGAIHSVLALYGLDCKDDPKHPDQLAVYSGNRKVGAIDKSAIDGCIEAYKSGIHIDNRKKPSYDRPEIFRRKSVLFNKLNEYASKGLTLEEIMQLSEFRKMGFSIDHKVIVDSKQQEHHQWTVVDYVSKSRYDGRDIGVPIETLLRGPEYAKSAEEFQALVNQILSEEGPRCNWTTMCKRLGQMHIKLKRGVNSISYMTKDNFFLYIDRDQVRQLQYWERVSSVRKIQIHNQDEARVLAALHTVKLMDVIPETYAPFDDLAYQQDLDTQRGRFTTFFQLRDEMMQLLAKKEKAPDKKLSEKDEARIKVLKELMNQKFSEGEKEAIIRDGERYFFYTQSVGIVNLDDIVGRKLTDEELRALRRPIIDLAVITRSQGKWLRYINQIIEEGGSIGIEKEQGISGHERAEVLRDAYLKEREAKQQEWELKKAAMEARRRSYTGPKPGSVRPSLNRDRSGGSPLMESMMRPSFLQAILQVCHDIQRATRGGGVAVTGSGRKRKRKRGDDDDDDE